MLCRHDAQLRVELVQVRVRAFQAGDLRLADLLGRAIEALGV